METNLHLRIQILRNALENIENVGAEHPDEDMTAHMFAVAHTALLLDDKSDFDLSCDLCRVRHVMRLVMSVCDDLPQYDVPMFDDPITDVFNAADLAHGRFEHPGCNTEDTDNDN